MSLERAQAFARIFAGNPANEWLAYEVAKQLGLDRDVLDIFADYFRLVGDSPAARSAWQMYVESDHYQAALAIRRETA